MTSTAPPLDVHAMQRAAVQASGLLKAMANPDRLLLLCQMAHGEHCVSELEGLLGITQPTLSQQLGVLRQEGLVVTRRVAFSPKQVRLNKCDAAGASQCTTDVTGCSSRLMSGWNSIGYFATSATRVA